MVYFTWNLIYKINTLESSWVSCSTIPQHLKLLITLAFSFTHTLVLYHPLIQENAYTIHGLVCWWEDELERRRYSGVWWGKFLSLYFSLTTLGEKWDPLDVQYRISTSECGQWWLWGLVWGDTFDRICGTSWTKGKYKKHDETCGILSLILWTARGTYYTLGPKDG